MRGVQGSVVVGEEWRTLQEPDTEPWGVPGEGHPDGTVGSRLVPWSDLRVRTGVRQLSCGDY